MNAIYWNENRAASKLVLEHAIGLDLLSAMTTNAPQPRPAKIVLTLRPFSRKKPLLDCAHRCRS